MLNKKIKILFCGEFPRRNINTGSNSVNTELIDRLSQNKNIDIKALSPVFKNEVGEKKPPTYYIKTNYFRNKGFGDIMAKFSFVRGVEDFIKQTDFKPDILHVDANPYLCNILPSTPKILFLYGAARPGSIFDIFRHPYSIFCQIIEAYHERKVFKNRDVKKIFVSSQYVKDKLIKTYSLTQSEYSKMEIVRLGHNIERFQIESSTKEETKRQMYQKLNIPIESSALILLFVGGIASHKGQRELIASIDILRKVAPQIILLLVGKDAGDMENCKKDIQEKKLQNNVFLLNSLSDKELGMAFKSTDIYASASMEGFGINQVEAMAIGLPIVAWDRGSVKELFNDGKEGFLVNNREDFINKTTTLIQNKSLREKMGLAAKWHSEKTFSWRKLSETVTRAYFEIFENL